MKSKSTSGFTLLELMFAVTITVMVMAVVGTLMVSMVRLWRDCTGKWELVQHARKSREKILRGYGVHSGVRFGLREATPDVKVYSNGRHLRYYRPTMGPGDEPKWVSVMITGSKRLKGISQGNPTRWYSRKVIKSKALSFEATNGVVDLSIEHTYKLGGKEFTNVQHITTQLYNF